MDMNKLLSGVQCSCGKHHTCKIQKIWIESGAIEKLSGFCSQYHKILLIADENTYQAAGQITEKYFWKKIKSRVIFSGKTLVIPNEEAIEKIEKEAKNADLILAVGSGVMQDLGKYVSWHLEIPYAVIATAPSMDGYASTGAAMILNGMKETVSAGLPLAIAADIDIIKNAPMDMIRSGYGDIIGKYSALCDWELSRIINGEYFCPYIYDTTYRMIEKTLALAPGLMKRDRNSIQSLTEALIVVGVMMSFAGSSRPASGSEHHLSHFFEITGILNKEPYFSHGIDVAYAAVITSAIREQLIHTPFKQQRFRLPEKEYVSRINSIYTFCAADCIRLQKKVRNYAADRTNIYLEKEQEIKALFRRYPSAQEMQNSILVVGLDMKNFYDMYGKEKIKNAVAYAKDLKDRYTVLWLLYDLFGENTKGWDVQ